LRVEPECEQTIFHSEQLPFLVRLRDDSEISAKCHIQREDSWPVPCKNGLSVRFGSNDSGTPTWAWSFSPNKEVDLDAEEESSERERATA
jgi:hypothetical protein